MSKDIFTFLLLLLGIADRWLQHESVLLWGILLALYFSGVLLRERRRLQHQRFINQLKSHRRELRNGGTVAVDGLLLRYDSLLCTYTMSIGVLFVHFEIPSPYRLARSEERSAAFWYTLASLISGWWAFPHGPLGTIRAVQENLRGGNRNTVRMLIDGELVAQEHHEKALVAARKQLLAVQRREKKPKSHFDTGKGFSKDFQERQKKSQGKIRTAGPPAKH